MFERILDAIGRYDRIIIHRHGRPDGDAIGSQVGLQYLLKNNYPEKEIYTVGDAPGFFGFVEGCAMDEIPDSTYEGSLAVILDSGSRSMVNDERYTLAAFTVRIDHHIFCEKFADEEVVDISFESCCGMIAAMAMEAGWKADPISAKALYTGMVTDSGRFRYDGTTARTHTLAAFLMEQKFDTNALFKDLYADSYESKKLKAQFILKIRFTEKNVAYIYTTKEELAALEADLFTVSRGMTNTMADMKGVDIWVNFTECDKGVLCELRSNRFNINPIAVKYGGGGHAKASGATVADKNAAMAMLADLDAMMGEAL